VAAAGNNMSFHAAYVPAGGPSSDYRKCFLGHGIPCSTDIIEYVEPCLFSPIPF